MEAGLLLFRCRTCAALGVCIAVMLGGFGCSSYAPPSLRVTGAAVTAESEEGFVISFRLEGTNTNDEPLPLHQVNYSVSLDGKRVFSGVRSAEVTLPRYGKHSLELPAAISRADYEGLPDDLTGSDVRFQISGELVYITPGNLSDLLFDVGIRRPKVAFVERGVFRDEDEPVDDADAGG